jgi:hypothetical protein
MLSRRRKRLRITEQATKAQATTTEELNEDDEFGGEDDLRAFADATAGDKDIDVSLIDDTIATISLLSNRHENSFAQLNIPPVILWHQLYGLLLFNCFFCDEC